ncbi:MAG: tail protein X [Selenomonadaceae bacterium]|nr:tail protein X [Selenomonadaceae bacterium]
MDKIYSTIQGDTFDVIAKKVYGSEEYMTDLLKANQKYNDTVIFSAGVKIICPEFEQKILSYLLPPWKR